MAGAVDMLVGLKENVILGHLIPAGTAFNPHLNIKIKKLVRTDEEPEVQRPVLPAAVRAGAEPMPQAGV